jgi:alpha-L-fucosidase
MAGLAALLNLGVANGGEPDVASSPLSPYEPTWNSLKRHHNPQWLSEAKFGIYTHWGPPKASDLATWKPDEFDPEAWGELIQTSGARFAGPVSEHGVQVAMWDSKLAARSIAKQGLKRDVMGEVKAALAKRGIRFLASFHAFTPKERRLAAGGKVREVVNKYDPDVIFFDLGMGGSLDARNSGSYIGGKKLNGKSKRLFRGA